MSVVYRLTSFMFSGHTRETAEARHLRRYARTLPRYILYIFSLDDIHKRCLKCSRRDRRLSSLPGKLSALIILIYLGLVIQSGSNQGGVETCAAGIRLPSVQLKKCVRMFCAEGVPVDASFASIRSGSSENRLNMTLMTTWICGAGGAGGERNG